MLLDHASMPEISDTARTPEAVKIYLFCLVTEQLVSKIV